MQKKINTKKTIAVLYHADCPDGFGSAWAAWKKFGERAVYLPVYHQSAPPEEIKGKDVYTLDFSYSPDVIKKLLKSVRSLTIIDHHITNESAVDLASDHLFQLNHSGSVLSWTYFHPEKKVPKLLLTVEDFDLWHFHLPFTSILLEAITLRDFDFNIWNKMASDFENKSKLKKYLEEGKIVVKNREKDIEKLFRFAETVKFEGYKCLAVNSPFHISFVGNEMVKKMPPIAIIWFRMDGRIKVSLRSDGKVDVAKLAQKYGGGGHKAAAGFCWDINKPLPFKFLKKIIK